MKKKLCISLLLFASMMLASCGNTDATSGTDSVSDPTSSSDSSGVGLNVDISSIREMEVGVEVRVQGVVANLNYTGQGTPYVTGFWLADATGSIYVYGEEVAQTLEKGNTVTMYGTKSYYIPDTDTGSAAATGYIGMQQLINPDVVSVNYTVSPIPETAISELTIAEITEIPLTTDITGNIYRVQGRYHRHDNISYVNYSVVDLNRVDSLLAYTQSNGKDYYWTDSYDGKTIEMIIIISLGKPGVGMWRMNPVEFIEEISVTALQEAEYGAQRAINEIADFYEVETTKEVTIEDELLSGLTRSYSSSSTKVSISQSNGNNVLVFHADELGVFELTATATFGGQTATASKAISIREPNEFDAISISEAKAQPDGATVTVQAIVARVTYKGSMTKQGMFLIDTSGTIFVYNGSATQANLANVENGNKVVVTGTIVHYIKPDLVDVAASQNFEGNLQISDVTVDNLDTNVYQLPIDPILDGTVEGVLATPPSTNISSNIYKMTVSVSKVAAQYYTNYYLDSLSSSQQLLLYSQNNGRDYEWLEPYLGLEIDIYVGIQELNVKASGSVWRMCAIAVVETD
jgi:predicted small secreted protein